MNSLSWMLYLAELTEKLSILLLFFGVICVGLAIWFGISAANWDNTYDETERQRVRKWYRFWAYPASVLAVLLLLVSLALPSRNTVYAIAAVEYSARIMKTPLATKAERALEAWLDKQVANDPAKKDD